MGRILTACDHRIDLVPDARLTTGPIYRLARKEDEWVQDFLTTNCATGHLRQSTAPHSSPIFAIPKKDGTYRLVTDYRKLNAVTVKDATPLPSIETILDQMAGAEVFISCDLPRAYQLIRMADGHEHYTTIRHQRGQHESLVMRDGLCNAPATFQGVRCWSFFVDLAAFGLLVSRDRTKRLDPKRTAMTVFGNSRKLVSDLSLLLTR
jgi:hypothetical protein